MPRSSDFAYAVHTDVGSRAVARATITRPVPLRTHCTTATVEIITAATGAPNPAWLGSRTGKARR